MASPIHIYTRRIGYNEANNDSSLLATEEKKQH
jgi:hypothetical protein